MGVEIRRSVVEESVREVDEVISERGNQWLRYSDVVEISQREDRRERKSVKEEINGQVVEVVIERGDQ